VDLKELAKEIHNNAVDKGFHNIGVYGRSQARALILCEAIEVFEADRAGNRADLLAYYKRIKLLNDIEKRDYFERHIKETVECEVADVYISVLDFAMAEKFEGLIWEIIPSDLGYSISDFLFGVALHVGLVRDGSICNLNFILQGCVNLAKSLDFDLFEFVKLKMEYNKKREYLHGKLY